MRLPDAEGVLLETLVLDDVQDRQADRARYRLAAEGVEVLHSVCEALRDLGRGDDGAQWMPVPHGLAHGHDVGHDALSLEGPEVASHAAEAHLDLVADAHAAVLAHQGVCRREVARSELDLPTAAQQALADERGGGRTIAAAPPPWPPGADPRTAGRDPGSDRRKSPR